MSKKMTKREVDLALRWARGEVRFIDIRRGKSHSNTYIFLARALRQHYRDGSAH